MWAQADDPGILYGSLLLKGFVWSSVQAMMQEIVPVRYRWSTHIVKEGLPADARAGSLFRSCNCDSCHPCQCSDLALTHTCHPCQCSHLSLTLAPAAHVSVHSFHLLHLQGLHGL